MRTRIDELFLDHSTPEKAYRLETFRSAGSISATASQQLRCYFVTKCNFPIKAEAVPGQKTDIRQVSDPIFLEKATENTLEIYQKVSAHNVFISRTFAYLISLRAQVIWNVESRYGPVMEVFEVEGSRERRLVIGYKMGGTSRFFRYVL